MSQPSTTTNAVLVNLLVHYGQKLSKAPKREPDPDLPIPGKVLKGASLADVPLSSEDYFLFTICSSGLARTLSLVANRELTNINDVKNLWLHHTGFPQVLGELLAHIEKLYVNGTDRSVATEFMNELATQASCYFEGFPYEDPRSDWVGDIDFFLKKFVEIETSTVSFIPNAANPALERKLGQPDFIFSVYEDEEDDDEDYEPVSMRYAPRKAYSSSEVAHLTHRRRGEPIHGELSPIKAEILTDSVKEPETKPVDARVATYFAECEEDFRLLKTEKQPAYGEPAVRKCVQNIIEHAPKGLAFYSTLGIVSSLISNYLKSGPRAEISPTSPPEKVELVTLLWGDEEIPNKRLFGIGVPVDKPPAEKVFPVEQPIISKPKGKEKVKAPTKVEVTDGSKKTISINMLEIELDLKTFSPNIFSEKRGRFGVTKLPLRRPIRERIIPQRRLFSEFRSRKLNTAREAKSMHFSQSGSSKGSRKRGFRQLATHSPRSGFVDRDGYIGNQFVPGYDFPERYEFGEYD